MIYRQPLTLMIWGLVLQARAKARTQEGSLDVIVHVGQLNEGFDAPAISVIALFTVFRSIARFNQTVGRAARRIKVSATEAHVVCMGYTVSCQLVAALAEPKTPNSMHNPSVPF